MTLYVGGTDTAQIDLPVWGSDTVAVLQVTNPAGVVTSPTVTPVDYGDPTLAKKSWRGAVPLPLAGEYQYRWTITNTGANVFRQRVGVAPADDAADTRHTYATTTQYANYMHEAPPDQADRKLKDATAAVDDLLLCAVYNVDANGLPTDTDTKTALMQAVCEQTKWRAETGDDDTADLYQSVSIAGVALSRAQAGQGQARTTRYGPKVRPILAKAGLLGAGPWSY